MGAQVDKFKALGARLQMFNAPEAPAAEVSLPCGNPECEYPANPDPTVCVGFCCEKCEGRFNGEEWALGGKGKKKHTAACTSRAGERAEKEAVRALGLPKKAAAIKCKNPDCTYQQHSDPTVCVGYCCEKCMGVHLGEDWAKGGKKHLKSCQKREVKGLGATSTSWESSKSSSWRSDPYGGGWGNGMPGMQNMMQQMMSMMMMSGGGPGMKWGDNGHFNYPKDQKVWLGNLPQDLPAESLEEQLKDHLALAGGTVV